MKIPVISLSAIYYKSCQYRISMFPQGVDFLLYICFCHLYRIPCNYDITVENLPIEIEIFKVSFKKSRASQKWRYYSIISPAIPTCFRPNAKK